MKLLLLMLAAVLVLPSCKKDAPGASLPPATQVGANTAGCLIEGQPFVAASYGGSLLSNPIPALQYGFSFDSVCYLIITGVHQGKRATVSLFLRSDSEGTYLLNKDTQYYPQGSPKYVLDHATYSQSDSNGEVYVTDSRHTGKIVLTYASVQSGIAAGTFEFTAVSQTDPSKTATITDGRFDRKQ